VFLLPSRMAPAVPAIRLPPVATTLASANWDAPVNAKMLSAHACQVLRPELTAAAPKASPESPTARPRPMPSRTGAGPRPRLELRPGAARAGPEPGDGAAGS